MSSGSTVRRPDDAAEVARAPFPDVPLVTTIIPNRNYARWLPACIESCLAQTHPRHEIIVVDDASTDESEVVLARYKSRIKVIRLPAIGGPAAARNAGLAVAQGDFIQFLDSDDYISRDKIARQLTLMRRDRADLCMSGWRVVVQLGPFGVPLPVVLPPKPELVLAETVLDHRWVPVMACLFSRSLIDGVGSWNESLSWNEDRDYRLRILAKRPLIVHEETCGLFYRQHGESSRSNAPTTDTDAKRARLEVTDLFLENVAALAAIGKLTKGAEQHAFVARLAKQAEEWRLIDQTKESRWLAVITSYCAKTGLPHPKDSPPAASPSTRPRNPVGWARRIVRHGFDLAKRAAGDDRFSPTSVMLRIALEWLLYVFPPRRDSP